MDEKKDESPLTSADFHTIAQKQIMNAVFAALAETKMDWSLIAPFLETAREVCVGDFEENGRIRLHTMRAEGEAWVEAEEAFLGISVSRPRRRATNGCRKPGGCPTSRSPTAIREQVSAIVAALERTIAKLNDWLASPPGDAAATAPPGQGTGA